MNAPSEKVIDGVKYTFCKRGAIDALVMKAVLIKQFGPALPKLIQGVSLDTSVDDLKRSLRDMDLEGLVSAVCTHFDPEAIPGFIKLVLKNVIAEGHGRIVDKIDVAIPEWSTLIKVVVETLKVEYGSFLAGKLGKNAVTESELPGMTLET